jgi:hypothetical protein
MPALKNAPQISAGDPSICTLHSTSPKDAAMPAAVGHEILAAKYWMGSGFK